VVGGWFKSVWGEADDVLLLHSTKSGFFRAPQQQDIGRMVNNTLYCKVIR